MREAPIGKNIKETEQKHKKTFPRLVFSCFCSVY